MQRTLKNGEVITIEKQFRNLSNNYINDDSKIFADLFQVRYNDGSKGVVCATEINEL